MGGGGGGAGLPPQAARERTIATISDAAMKRFTDFFILIRSFFFKIAIIKRRIPPDFVGGAGYALPALPKTLAMRSATISATASRAGPRKVRPSNLPGFSAIALRMAPK